MTEKPSETELKSIYSANYYSNPKYENTNALQKEHQKRLDIIRRYINKKHAVILDFGCARAEFIEFANHEYDMYGFDFYKNPIQEAHKKNPELKSKLKAGILTETSYLPESFDGVVMWDVIEHLWDPTETLKNLFHFIKPGGFLFISTPNINSLSAIFLKQYWALMTPPEHLSFLTVKTFHHLARNILNSEIIYWKATGKWANIGFVIYKLKRILPRLIPDFLINFFKGKYTSKWMVYIFTKDIQYMVIKKKE